MQDIPIWYNAACCLDFTLALWVWCADNAGCGSCSNELCNLLELTVRKNSFWGTKALPIVKKIPIEEVFEAAHALNLDS